jgi:hypothetical protein
MDLFERSNITGLLDAMTEDATWEIVGKPELFAGAGVETKADWPASRPTSTESSKARLRCGSPV